MIEEWGLENFKAFRAHSVLAMRPITVLAGENSAGKSTIIQSILLLTQTARQTSGLSGHLGYRREATLNLNGEYVKFGEFSDVVNFHQQQKHESASSRISFKMRIPIFSIGRIDLDSTNGTIDADIHFRSNLKSKGNVYERLHPKLNKVSIKIKYTAKTGSEIQRHLSIVEKSRVIENIKVQNTISDDIKNALTMKVVEIDPATRSSIIGKNSRRQLKNPRIIGASFTGVLPNSILVKYDKSYRYIENLLSSCGITPFSPYTRDDIEDIPNNYRIWLLGFLKNLSVLEQRTIDYLSYVLLADDQDEEQISNIRRYRQFARTDLRKSLNNKNISIIREKMTSLFSPHNVADFFENELIADSVIYATVMLSDKVRYLGPLRDDPKPIYPVGGSVHPADIGVKGESTAAVLNRFQDQQITYVPPSSFSDDGYAPQKRQSNLKDALVDWLQYLGVALDYESEDRGKLGHELRIRTTRQGKFHDLTNVGVGVSQVLPILCLCLLAEEESILIIEQPELHLHPAVCGRLADFFLTMTHLDKQCILETHGQHIIERFRLRTAQTPSLLDKIAAHFLEHTVNGAKVTQIEFTRFGSIVNWPDGFFDQSQKETRRLMKAAADRVKVEKTSNK